MTLEVLQKDMIAAMKSHDKTRKDTLSLLIAAAKKLAIDSMSKDNVTEELVDKAISKELKIAQEQVDTCPASREDLKTEYQTRLDIIKEYAPVLLSREEIKNILTTEYADVIASGNKGQIMKTVMPALKGKADGKDIQAVVSELL
jgi:uncharacterized protein YqeY